MSPPPQPAPVRVCDRRQIAQALTNLGKNATEAVEARRETDSAAGLVEIAIAQEAGRLVVSVLDDGVGLPRERDRITGPYVTTRMRGTGLGLAIVKKIVEEHFGSLEFLDRPGGGTRSEEHTSELQSLMRNSYAVFCLKKKNYKT